MRRRRLAESWWLTAALALASPAYATSFDIDTLMRDLAQTRPAEVRFTEKKYSELLTVPLQTAGTLRYTPPDRLEKHVLTPYAEDLVVDGAKAAVTRNDRTRTLDLSEYPSLRAFVESLRATLAGDRQTLERYYRLHLGGDETHWSLELEPADSEMRSLVRSVRIEGTRGRVEAVEVLESDGDRSVMTIAGGH